MKTLVCIILILVIFYLLAIMPRMIGRPDFAPFRGRLYAHRGLHDNATEAPENSMRAFSKAIEAGYGIEFDVQLTKDEQLVVVHDFDLKRICGADVKIRDLTYEELQQYHICGSSQTIPLFSEVLALVAGKVPLIIEYKVPGMKARVCELADPLLRSYEGVYCVESFHPAAVLWYRRHRSEVMRGILSDSYTREGYHDFPWIAYQLLHHLLLNFLIKPDFVAYDCKYPKDVSRCLCYWLFRAPAVAWTVKSGEQLDALDPEYDLFIFDSFVPSEKQIAHHKERGSI